MEEQKTLTEQVIAEQQPAKTAVEIEKELLEQQEAQQGQMAEQMTAQLLPYFKESLYKLSNNELRKLIMVLIQFPFVKVTKNTLNDKQKAAFMFGERLIYANMVKRAQAELVRTFGEVEKEQEEAKLPNNVDVSPEGAVTLGTPGNEEQTHTVTGEKSVE